MSDSLNANDARQPESNPFDPPVVLLVWLSFLVYGAIAAPVPAVNEPHYLCKAKHYWQPEWCSGDFFLESSNAHVVFFATIGSLTQWLSFEQTACIGRVLASLILAVGWCALMKRLASQRWFGLMTCWQFLALQSCGNFSGEWLIGGVEGKVFSYGFLFAALGQFLDGHTIRSGALTGMAIAFHPVVGVWGVLAAGGAIACDRVFQNAKRQPTNDSPRPNQSALGSPHSALGTPYSALRTPNSALSIALGLVAMIALALPGLIPVFRLLAEPVAPQTKFAANFIQVYYRLAHHLDPMQFLARAYIGYAVLIAIWLLLARRTPQSTARKWTNRIVAFSILFALAGVLIGYGPRPAAKMVYFAQRAQLLKFYPFRLADVLVPLVVAIQLTSWLVRREVRLWQWCGFALLFIAALFRAHSITEVNRYSGELRPDWIDACRWIDEHLPNDVLVQAPHNGWAFRWFAHRAEYVAFKDCPQDAAGIVEWNRRLNFLKKWFEDKYTDQFYSAEELRDLRRQTGITHILTDHLGPLALEPIYRNATFQVYDLTTLDQSAGGSRREPHLP
jgi:hypothetical protein